MSISKRNRRGILGVIVVLVLLAYVPRVIASLNSSEVQISQKSIDLAEEKVAKKIQAKEKENKHKYSKSNKKSKYQAPTAKFDPNNYSKSDWMNLGLSEKQADVVLRFTERGIYSNVELEKIVVIPEQVFDLLKDSTYYPEKPTNKFQSKPVSKKPTVVDLNTANYDQLIDLYGIGDYYANKIIDYRNKLGGYVGAYQLLEIWKFDNDKYDAIKEQLKVSDQVKKININAASIDELKTHPYISYKVANSIVKMRDAHGDYNQVSDILESVLIDRILFVKIEPYLTIE